MDPDFKSRLLASSSSSQRAQRPINLKMPHTTFSSTSTSSDSVPRTFTLGQASSYPRELDIDGSSSGTSTSGGTTAPPLMAYSTPFTSNWRKDFGSSTNTHRQYQERSSWSTKGNAGSNP
ncbi:hypothetical protein F5Y07DRAFT_401964 [Xylaria sp. FL0933]|nr:hypothetical protein F5Y07DRAFT_401964 [Xylaria sp. FL0933]